jgi:transcriptional regulator with XRE-family HTH domain
MEDCSAGRSPGSSVGGGEDGAVEEVGGVMAGRHKWADLRRRGTPEQEAQARARTEAELAAYGQTLRELRQARAFTQVQLAQSTGTAQNEISRIERRTDLYLSTLLRFVAALGGRLELHAVFEDRRFEIALGDVIELPAEPPTPSDRETVKTNPA